MGIFDSLLGRKPKAATKIELHADCRAAHGPTLSSWLSGSAVEVLNPSNGQWEVTDNPTFEPQYRYRVKAPTYIAPPVPRPVFDDGTSAVVPVSADWGILAELQGTVGISGHDGPNGHNGPDARDYPDSIVVTPNVAAVTKPYCHYKRGDVYTNAAGITYIVLANKYDVIPGYNPSIDPDSNPLVVMRYNCNVKQAVSTRDFAGRRADGISKYAIGGVVGPKMDLFPIADDGTNPKGIFIYSRLNGSGVYLDSITGEVRFG